MLIGARMRGFISMGLLLGLVLAGGAEADWSESFTGGGFDLPDWLCLCYPDVTQTFSCTFPAGDGGNCYLSLDETTSVGAMPPGSAFGFAGVLGEEFTDVRVGAKVNVAGDANRNYCALAGRATYFTDDGSISGAPGALASAYLMMIDWEKGPANLTIDVRKVVNLANYMGRYELIPVPGLDHARSYYALLDVVGSDPVYVTGRLYAYEGGPLVARTPTLVDTGGDDAWEPEDAHGGVFAKGFSGVAGVNEHAEPAGYHVTFDDISSVSGGPAAVCLTPADGAADVPVDVDLSWVEANFAASRQLWFGKELSMRLIEPGPEGAGYDPGALEFGRTYQWRIDEVGPSGTVTGSVWSFTTANCLNVDDFEGYTDDAGIASAWVHNIAGDYEYVFLEGGEVHEGNRALRFEYQNQYDPYFTEITRTFDDPQDWAAAGVATLSLAFRGDDENVAQPMYVRVEDATAQTYSVAHPHGHAVEARLWQEWDISLELFGAAGVDLTAVKRVTLGIGNGSASGQASEDRDVVYVDHIGLCPPKCLNVGQLDLCGDVNGDCVIDFKDLAILATGWLNEGSSLTP